MGGEVQRLLFEMDHYLTELEKERMNHYPTSLAKGGLFQKEEQSNPIECQKGDDLSTKSG